jgi:hypothetical protein
VLVAPGQVGVDGGGVDAAVGARVGEFLADLEGAVELGNLLRTVAMPKVLTANPTRVWDLSTFQVPLGMPIRLRVLVVMFVSFGESTRFQGLMP